MNCSWVKYFSLIIIIAVFAACHNSGKNSGESNPVLNSDPNLKKITDLIHDSPKDAALYFKRGILLRKMQLDTLALNDFKKAAMLDTGRAEYYSAVGDVLFENKDIAGSAEWIQKAIAKNPEDRKARLKIAKLFLYIRKYPQAFEQLNIVLRKNVYDPEAYFLKGMLYKDMKDTARAISNFLTSVQVAPEYRESILQLGVLYSAKNDSIALKYFDNAFRIDTMDVFPIYAKGIFFQNHKDYARAKDAFKECIIRDHRYPDAYFNMGYILMQQDSIQKAWRQYDIVTKIDPMNPSAYFNRGLCSEMMDSMKKAVADYRLASSLDTSYKSPKEALRRLGVGK
jgi:tetratricopeptide (TPR) repeat protein